LKNSASVVSTINVGAQTLTDLALTTVVRKQTESLVSDTDPTPLVFNTDDTANNESNSLNKNTR